MQQKIKEKDPSTDVFCVETGHRFREFIKEDTYSSILSKEIMERGALQPEFLAIWNWSSMLVGGMKANQHLILDGTPRKVDEAEVLDSAMRFYGREKPFVIFLDVSKEFSFARFKERMRSDDKEKSVIEERMKWYEEHVIGAVRYYWKNESYRFLHIQGEQSIQDVHNEIIAKLGIL